MSDSGPSVSGAIPGRVSVIVPTRNSARTLKECLTSVHAQTYGDVELVVVDNYSTDDSREIAERFTDHVVVTGPERSAQRNMGARAASGDILFFVDGDMIMSLTVAEEIAREFDRDAAVQSLVVPLRSIGDNFWARCRALEKDLYIGDPDMEGARAFRRAAFEQVGGYDERLHAGEDWDLSERVVSVWGVIGRTRAGLIHDEGRVSLRELLAKKRYYGQTLGRYVHKHPGLALRKVLRLAFLRNSRVLMRDPLLGMGLVLLKALELVAALAGAVMSFAANLRASAGSRADG